MKTKVFVVSLGCSKNHCDLENMMGILVDKGYEITLDEYEADVALVNTCGFIESAKEEAISNILEMAELKETGNLKALVVSGCLSQRYKEEILDSFPEVDAVVGVFDFDKIVLCGDLTYKPEKITELISKKTEKNMSCITISFSGVRNQLRHLKILKRR